LNEQIIIKLLKLSSQWWTGNRHLFESFTHYWNDWFIRRNIISCNSRTYNHNIGWYLSVSRIGFLFRCLKNIWQLCKDKVQYYLSYLWILLFAVLYSFNTFYTYCIIYYVDWSSQKWKFFRNHWHLYERNPITYWNYIFSMYWINKFLITFR
jgi:hypothetical protein